MAAALGGLVAADAGSAVFAVAASEAAASRRAAVADRRRRQKQAEAVGHGSGYAAVVASVSGEVRPSVRTLIAASPAARAAVVLVGRREDAAVAQVVRAAVNSYKLVAQLV